MLKDVFLVAVGILALILVVYAVVRGAMYAAGLIFLLLPIAAGAVVGKIVSDASHPTLGLVTALRVMYYGYRLMTRLFGTKSKGSS